MVQDVGDCLDPCLFLRQHTFLHHPRLDRYACHEPLKTRPNAADLSLSLKENKHLSLFF